MKKTIQYFAFILMALCFLPFETAFAASFSVASNTYSVSPGGSFTVSVNLSGNGSGMVYFTGNNVSLSSGSVYCETTCSVNATAQSSGNAVVNVIMGSTKEDEVTDRDDVLITGSQSVTVQVIQPSSGGSTPTKPTTPSTSRPSSNPNETRSINNNLKSIHISKGHLSPSFQSDITTYKVSLDARSNDIDINAILEDSKANLNGNGKHSLKAGLNKIELVCTAENESTKRYLLEIMVDEKPLVFTEFEDQKLGVIRNLEGVQIPDGFSASNIKFESNEVNAWHNPNSNKTLVYLMNKTGEKNFYLYDQKKKRITSIYQPITIANQSFLIMKVPDKLKKMTGYTFEKITIQQQVLDGWSFNHPDFKNYVLVYLYDKDNKGALYQYEKVSNTLQPFSNAAAILQRDYEHDVHTNQMMQIGLGVVIVLLIACNLFTYLYFKKKTNP